MLVIRAFIDVVSVVLTNLVRKGKEIRGTKIKKQEIILPLFI